MHEHKYIQGDIGELCDVCGLLRSTIEGIKENNMPNPTPPAIHERDGEYMTEV